MIDADEDPAEAFAAGFKTAAAAGLLSASAPERTHWKVRTCSSSPAPFVVCVLTSLTTKEQLPAEKTLPGDKDHGRLRGPRPGRTWRRRGSDEEDEPAAAAAAVAEEEEEEEEEEKGGTD